MPANAASRWREFRSSQLRDYRTAPLLGALAAVVGTFDDVGKTTALVPIAR
jgi:hypothetical protein